MTKFFDLPKSRRNKIMKNFMLDELSSNMAINCLLKFKYF